MLNNLIRNFQNNTLTHSLLFYENTNANNIKFIHNLAKLLLCINHNNCNTCQHCKLINSVAHPDLHIITAEKSINVIKIEQIREIIAIAYTSTQLNSCRIILIEYPEHMNKSASNALLKILEEPPENVYFIAYSTCINFIAPTIMSRFQLWSLPKDIKYSANIVNSELLLMSDLTSISDDLLLLLQKKISAITLANQWLKYDLYQLSSIVYWLNMQLTMALFSININNQHILKLLPYVSMIKLVAQIDKINIILFNLKENIHMNQLLIIEDLLFIMI